jgi:hypothetical protein
MMKKNNGEYHIHVDAEYLSSEATGELIENFGFKNTAFSGHAPDALHFETKRHFTFKTEIHGDFECKFDAVNQYFLDHVESIIGYLEGEYVPVDLTIDPREFNPNVAIPFELRLGDLELNSFREDEIHITLDREQSDPRLLESLRGMGFFSAYMDKPQCNVEIFTAQGSKKNIKEVVVATKQYLELVGGAINCSVKEEMILRWWKSNPHIALPPVVNTVQYS